MGPLDQLRSWPVGEAAAVVVNGRGVLARTGPDDRSFPLASVTKVLVALAVLVAVEEGPLGLGDPAGPAGSTVRHLLAHASGLAPDDEGVLAPPASRRIYSNQGFEVLGATLEEAGGLDVATYLREAVAEPLGLSATTLQGSPAHGARASAEDVGRVAVELLSPTLISPATLAEATAPVFPDLAGVLPGFGHHDPNPWGLGVEIRGRKWPHWTGAANSARTFGHFGRAGTFCWVDPEAGLACVVLTDTDFGPWAARAWPVLADAVLDTFAGAGAAGR